MRFLHIPQCADDVSAITIDNRILLFFEVHHILCVLYNRRGIRGYVKFIIAYTDHHRAAFTGGYQLVGIIFIKHHYCVCAYHLVEGYAHCVIQ